MSRVRLIDKVVTRTVASATNGESINLEGGETVAIHHVAAVSTPTAKTFAAGVAATLVNQGLTYTAVSRGAAGNDIEIELLDPSANDATLAITVTGTLISVSLATGSGGAITTTRTQLQTALAADSDVTALVSVSGSGASAVTALTATALSGGIDSAVDVANDSITIANHGMVTGLVGQASSSGTLPAGLSTSTNYWVIKVDDSTIKLASSLANAVAGTAVDLTNQGTSAATHTFTSTALSGASVKVQKSLDEVSWIDVATATNITAAATNVLLEKIDPEYKFLRLVYAVTAGQLTCEEKILVKGE